MHSLPLLPGSAGDPFMPGATRVLAKLSVMGVTVPHSALDYPDLAWQPVRAFTRLEHAMMDWFLERDFELGQALIHFRPSAPQWHAVHSLEEDYHPLDISRIVICPSQVDAVAAAVSAARVDFDESAAWRREGPRLVAAVGGVDTMVIEPVHLEPFNRANRDRVRRAFKGIRDGDENGVRRALGALPGFPALPSVDRPRARLGDGLLLGFPSNWARAMRDALKQVFVGVTQAQAQELAAVFFGAANWHQLVKHDDVPSARMRPVCVSVETGRGWAHRFYHSGEEAIFAAGALVRAHPDALVPSPGRTAVLALGAGALALRFFRQRDLVDDPQALFDVSVPSLECGAAGYWQLDNPDDRQLTREAEEIVRLLG